MEPHNWVFPRIYRMRKLLCRAHGMADDEQPRRRGGIRQHDQKNQGRAHTVDGADQYRRTRPDKTPSGETANYVFRELYERPISPGGATRISAKDMGCNECHPKAHLPDPDQAT